MKKLLLMIFICGFFSSVGKAQHTAGTSGLLNTPSADFNPNGTFSMGLNYLPESVTPDRYDYPTGNFFINLTYFSFLELTFRSTLQRVPENGNKFSNQDRSMSARIRVLKESRILPALVIGSNDFLTSSFTNIVTNERSDNEFFASVYGVATKTVSISDNRLGFTLGYSYSTHRMPQFTGVLAGIRFNPSFYPDLSVITEYDAANFNTGASILLFKHFYFQAFTSNFNSISAGLSYRLQLKVR